MTAPGDVVLYWRPGCGFCHTLRRELDRAGVERTEINIWEDREAAAVVRSHARGNETVPTVVIGGRGLVNPSAADVVAAVGAPGPRRSETGAEPSDPGGPGRTRVPTQMRASSGERPGASWPQVRGSPWPWRTRPPPTTWHHWLRHSRGQWASAPPGGVPPGPSGCSRPPAEWRSSRWPPGRWLPPTHSPVRLSWGARRSPRLCSWPAWGSSGGCGWVGPSIDLPSLCKPAHGPGSWSGARMCPHERRRLGPVAPLRPGTHLHRTAVRAALP
ncbi:glutaredoxin domain-containing protein [Nocardioides sp.]|uniref:glutaredoxin family protein n=1 Tax=Nocardioides sp. TaxID=35761 RepID=UPI003449DBCC